MDENPYVKAISRERKLREEAYLSAPHFICGIPLKQITPRLLAVLFRIETPFLTGAEVRDGDVLRFLWACHVDNPLREERSRLFQPSKRQRFLASINAGFDFDLAVAEIDCFMEDTFMDSPDGKSSRPYACSIAWLEYSMCSKPFCWTREYTLDSPMRIIYQLLRCRALDNGAILKNRLSDPVLDSALEELNTPEARLKRMEEFRAKFARVDSWEI